MRTDLIISENVCDEYPDEIDLIWMYGKVNQRIGSNDNGNENGYFYRSERLMTDVEGAFLDDTGILNH
ncbi:hypothetical protein IB221_19105 [Pantoea sp. PNT01]|jgi:hypothetical protein|uniref:Uncharacterized protein n=1 Tax=Pantoea eucalypti TaxID=470933 RepID=A0ABY2ZQD8_9GAMM|nr:MULTISPECIES: hypothetical protein [Pantoea]PQL26454.1 hypothetical protein C5L22_20775 [Pantoea ananatis]MBD9554354.1 hypothetical protein [Pantoea sp. PNT01]MCD2358798.1 hypothetical protein [Pantoea sp. MHSD4]QGF29400.1 hypothetical protein EE896_21375 [Pantoea eucalypti]TPV37883.1 hypothetical protein FJW02_07495 [Pantoea eucalypti]